MIEPRTLCITSKQWKHVAGATAEDFKLLVAAHEFKVLDRLADKIRRYVHDSEPSEGQLDFLDLYDACSAYLFDTDHKAAPPWFVKLVNREVAL